MLSSTRSHRRTPETWLSSMLPVSILRSSSRRWKQTFRTTVGRGSPTMHRHRAVQGGAHAGRDTRVGDVDHFLPSSIRRYRARREALYDLDRARSRLDSEFRAEIRSRSRMGSTSSRRLLAPPSTPLETGRRSTSTTSSPTGSRPPRVPSSSRTKSPWTGKTKACCWRTRNRPPTSTVPVVFYLGLDEDWTSLRRVARGSTGDQEFENIRFQLLPQNGVDQYYLVQDTAGGTPVTRVCTSRSCSNRPDSIRHSRAGNNGGRVRERSIDIGC